MGVSGPSAIVDPLQTTWYSATIYWLITNIMIGMFASQCRIFVTDVATCRLEISKLRPHSENRISSTDNVAKGLGQCLKKYAWIP